jgi:hypothetical protein
LQTPRIGGCPAGMPCTDASSRIPPRRTPCPSLWPPGWSGGCWAAGWTRHHDSGPPIPTRWRVAARCIPPLRWNVVQRRGTVTPPRVAKNPRETSTFYCRALAPFTAHQAAAAAAAGWRAENNRGLHRAHLSNRTHLNRGPSRHQWRSGDRRTISSSLESARSLAGTFLRVTAGAAFRPLAGVCAGPT